MVCLQDILRLLLWVSSVHGLPRMQLCKEISSFFPNFCNYTTAQKFCSHICNDTQPEQNLTCGSIGKGFPRHRRVKRIVGGNTSAPAQWKWHVSLRLNNEHECGASLLSEHILLTAAHCLDPEYTSDNPRDYLAIAGAQYRTNSTLGQQTVRLKRIWIHSGYNVSFYPRESSKFVVVRNDIAIIELEDGIKLHDEYKVAPICLPDDNNRIPDHHECFIVGWGLTKFKGNFTERLRHAKIRTVPNSVCNQKVAFNNKINGSMILCAGDSNATVSPCDNDSGGGMACQKDGVWYLNGIISSGYECGGLNAYSLYANVGEYKNWFLETMFNNTSSGVSNVSMAYYSFILSLLLLALVC